MNALKIFSENWLNGDCGLTVNSGDATKKNLYDQAPASVWASVGSSDATEEPITIIFKDWEGTEIPCTFDRIILLNHNIKAGAFDYWDGSNWQVIAAAAMTAVSAANTLIELAAPITASQFRFRPLTTQVANAQKHIGELKVCLSVIHGTQLWRSEIPRADDQKAGSYRVGDGSLVFWREWTKYVGSGSLYDVTKADRDTLFPYLKVGGFVTVVFWSDFDMTECFEVAFTDAPKQSLDRRTGLYEISLKMEER